MQIEQCETEVYSLLFMDFNLGLGLPAIQNWCCSTKQNFAVSAECQKHSEIVQHTVQFDSYSTNQSSEMSVDCEQNPNQFCIQYRN